MPIDDVGEPEQGLQHAELVANYTAWGIDERRPFAHVYARFDPRLPKWNLTLYYNGTAPDYFSVLPLDGDPNVSVSLPSSSPDRYVSTFNEPTPEQLCVAITHSHEGVLELSGECLLVAQEEEDGVQMTRCHWFAEGEQSQLDECRWYDSLLVQ